MPRVTVSGFFADEDAMEEAVYQLVERGVPRDLVEVLVSDAGAARLTRNPARALGTRSLALAAAGGLVGLLLGAIVSLATVAWPGRDLPQAASLAQLLGPNALSLAGAVVGGAVGTFLPRRPTAEARRVLGRAEMLVVVHEVAEEEVEGLTARLGELGAGEVLVQR